ncbi:MAG: cytidine deaminase [Oscillospiraceae bacterium]|jgi:cytidine deaminase|nr:cytidine deaminase [Oscillospiraceae bacterium]
MTDKDLLMAAREARQNAYAPYSDFGVGAALLCDDGRVFTGCNVENACYPAGCCAERVALFNAVSAGARNFSAIAVTGWQRDMEGGMCMPCGVCRQVLYEFAADMRVITGTPEDIRTFKLSDLLPYGFGL